MNEFSKRNGLSSSSRRGGGGGGILIGIYYRIGCGGGSASASVAFWRKFVGMVSSIISDDCTVGRLKGGGGNVPHVAMVGFERTNDERRDREERRVV